MKKYFIAKESEWSGNLGFIEKGAPEEFTPLGGIGTAHDCLEHFPGDDGSIDHECMALGCSLWIRGTGGYDFRGSAETSIASEFYTMLWGYYLDGYTLRSAKSNLETTPLVHYTVALIKDGVYEEAGDDANLIDEEQLDEFVKRCTYWMQVGFNKAKKRYPECHTACYLFQQIEELADKALKYAYEGQEFEISYCVRKCTASIEEVNVHEYYY
jgi:hypothetical protein